MRASGPAAGQQQQWRPPSESLEGQLAVRAMVDVTQPFSCFSSFNEGRSKIFTTKQSKLKTARNVHCLLKSATGNQFITRALFSAHISGDFKHNSAFLGVLIHLEKL